MSNLLTRIELDDEVLLDRAIDVLTSRHGDDLTGQVLSVEGEPLRGHNASALAKGLEVRLLLGALTLGDHVAGLHRVGRDVHLVAVDNVIFRLGLAKTRRMARQVVNHGHILVNGHKVNIPSYSVKKGDVITVRSQSSQLEMFKALREGTTVVTPKWLTFDAANLTGTVAELPERSDIDFEVQENMIVEFYSR